MKRIICSILVVIMLALSLVSCGYSFRKDDMNNYASFTDQEGFAKALLELVVENGEFLSGNPEIREEKVLDNIYAAISSATKADSEKLKEGKPAVYDLVYYAYYATAEFDGVTSILYTDKLKTASPASILLQNRNDYGEDTFSEGLAKLLSEYEFAKRDVLEAVTSGNLVAGDIAYVTYTKKEKGSTASKTYTRERIEIVEAAEGEAVTFASALLGKKITTTAFNMTEKKDGADVDIEFTEADGKTYIYSSVKPEFVVSRIKNGKTVEGDKAYVTYTVKNLEGDDKSVKKTNEYIVVGAAPAEGETAADLASFISGADISKIISGDDNKALTLTVKKTINVDANGDYTEAEDKIAGTKEIDVVYSDVTVNWVMDEDKAAAIGTFTDTTYEEETDEDKQTKVFDTAGEERVLNGKEITYYVYPVYYIDTPEYTAELLIDKVIGKNISFETICQILFVNEYAELDDDATEEDMNKINEKAVNFKSGDLTIKAIAEAIAKYYEDIEDAQTAIDNMQTALDTATEAYDNAVADGKTAEELDSAKKALDEAQAKYDEAVAKEKEIEETKTANIKKLLEIKETAESATVGEILLKNYKILNYNALQEEYNEELRMNLATEINSLIDKHVALKEGVLPEDAVEEAYEQFIDAYKSDYYNGTFDSTNKITNYAEYSGKGGFDEFLKVKVAEDEKVEVADAAAAKEVLMNKAKEVVGEMVKFYLVADVYDVVITKKEYNEYKDDLEDYYYYYVLYYKNFDLEKMIGKTNIEGACQFDKLMNHFLAFEEVKSETPDANGYYEITYKYTSKLVPETVVIKPEA